MSSSSTALDPGLAAQDTSWVALLVITLVLSLATLIVGMRIYTRIFLVKQLGWDDYCVVLTLVRSSVENQGRASRRTAPHFHPTSIWSALFYRPPRGLPFLLPHRS